MAKTILIKPVITEKADLLTERRNQYTFVVNKKANKLEIKKAVENTYSVTVEAVNTLIMPAKEKTRMTRSGQLSGRVSAYKKAVVTLPEGEEIDFFGDI
jgi:large subunit ribosomal protein L23